MDLQGIVVDDASTDRTAKILRRYDDAGFEIIRLAKNVGAAAAINHAFTLVRGEFVARIDYDDRYHPNFLVDSVDALQRHPDAAFVCAAVRMIEFGGRSGRDRRSGGLWRGTRLLVTASHRCWSATL